MVEFFRSLNPTGLMTMPVGDFRKAMIQVCWAPDSGACEVEGGQAGACLHYFIVLSRVG